MREFLQPNPAVGLDEGEGEGDQGKGKKKKGNRTVGTRVDEIVLEPTHAALAIAVGTKIPLYYECYEIDADGNPLPVLNADVEIIANTPGIVTFARTEGTLKGTGAGSTQIKLRDRTTSVESNSITTEAVICSGVDIVPPGTPMLKGQRISLLISFHTSAGHRTDLMIDGGVDETEMGRLSRGGLFTAGQIEGEATVRVRFAGDLGDNSTAVVEIGPESVAKVGRGGGADIPLILMCGDQAPGMEEYPPEQRTHQGGDHHPTIIEDPLFLNVVWINPHSKEAIRVRRRGPSGIAGIANKVFAQFLALKCFDILKRLKVRQDVGDQALTETQFMAESMEAEMACVGFIDAAYELADKL